MFVFLNLIAIAALVGIDQAIKLWAVQNLQPVGSMPLIPHVVELHFTYNEGMAFSLLWGRQEILIAATSIGMLLIAWWLFTHCRNDQLQRWALVLVLGGGIGNLIDRIAAGRVVDYINLLFMNFAVFNFADICVCVGMGLWVLSVILVYLVIPCVIVDAFQIEDTPAIRAMSLIVSLSIAAPFCAAQRVSFRSPWNV